MPKKIYYGDFRNKRKNDSKKRFIIMLSVIVIIGVIVWFTVFFGATGQKDVADAVKDNVQEITQLKLQIKERDDKILQLEAKLAEYENELAFRPTIQPMVIEPPNDEVLSGQPNPTPTPKPTKKPRSSSNKSSKSNNSNNSDTSGSTNKTNNADNENKTNTSTNNTNANNADNTANADKIVSSGNAVQKEPVKIEDTTQGAADNKSPEGNSGAQAGGAVQNNQNNRVSDGGETAAENPPA